MLAVGATARAGAQQAPQQGRVAAAGPGTIIGVVVDTLGRPVDGVTVFIDGRRRMVVTGTDGTFRFDKVDTDTSTVATRHSAFYPGAQRVTLGADGASVVIELVPRSQTLPAVVTEARAPGLRGVVSDTAFTALAGAEVQVLGGSSPIVRTDSMGTFTMDVTPGHYMVRVSRSGFQPAMLGVTVPPSGGRRLAVRLVPGADAYHARESAFAWSLRERLVLRSPARSRIFTREDIARIGVTSVAQAASVGAVRGVDDGCIARINGGFTAAPIWSLDPDEIELLEVYVGGPPSMTVMSKGVKGPTSINGMTAIRTQAPEGGLAPTWGNPPGCPTIFAWTSK